MKEINYTILYCVFVKTFVIPFYYGSGTVINHGFGFGSTRQKVTVPTVPVPQHGKKTKVLLLKQAKSTYRCMTIDHSGTNGPETLELTLYQKNGDEEPERCNWSPRNHQNVSDQR